MIQLKKIQFSHRGPLETTVLLFLLFIMINKINKQLCFAAAAWTLCWTCSNNVSAFQITNNRPIPAAAALLPPSKNPIAATAKATAAAATLAVLLTMGEPVAPAFAAGVDGSSSGAAAQIMVDQIPPTTISIQAKEIPVVGSIISGTYTKLDAKAVKALTSPPSVVISGPKDKIKFLKAAATEGHIEVDIGGQVGLKTHLDVDIAADEAGVAKVRIASDLVPALPFKNLASSNAPSAATKKGKESSWNVVTNMGNGESYYYNIKTGATQFEKPEKI